MQHAIILIIWSGTPEPVNIFEPLEKLAAKKASASNQINGKMLELVGRGEEMTLLEEVSIKWIQGAPALIVMMAPSGYGKSAIGSVSRSELSKLESVISWYE